MNSEIILLAIFFDLSFGYYQPNISSPTAFFETRSQNETGYTYTSYQHGIECTASLPPVTPTSLRDIQDIVYLALKNKFKLKVGGSHHSITDIICTDGMLIRMTEIKHFSFDPKTNLATVGAGVQLLDFLEQLHLHGRALESQPTSGSITIGGAIGSGSHGSSINYPATISDQIVSLTFVDGLGNIRRISEGDEDFKAFRVHLGLLGIIYEVVIRTREQYKLEMRHYPLSDDLLFKDNASELNYLLRNNDLFQFFWFPTSKQVVFSVGNRVPVNTTGNCETHLISEASPEFNRALAIATELMQSVGDHMGLYLLQSYCKLSLFKKVPEKTPIFTMEDGLTPCNPSGAVGFSHRMMSNRCHSCLWDLGENGVQLEDASISIPIEELPKALKTLKDIFDEFITPFPLAGILIRYLKKGKSLLGMNADGDRVDIEWASVGRVDKTRGRLGIAGYQAMGQALIERHHGRPHWAKNGLYFSSPNVLRRAYSNLPKFIKVMSKMDPNEVFMNDFGRRIKYGSSQVTASQEVEKRCALNEACLCKNDFDCGAGSPTDYECSNFKEFKVCKEKPNPINELRDVFARRAIDFASEMGNNLDFVVEKLSNYIGFRALKLSTAGSE